MRADLPVIAVDPGRDKCGIAVVAPDGAILHHTIVPTAMVGETVDVMARDHHARRILVGAGTTSRGAVEAISVFRPRNDILIVEEANSTLEARTLYWVDNPPGCLQMLIPAGLRIPPRPVDDYAAVVIARRFLAQQSEKR